MQQSILTFDVCSTGVGLHLMVQLDNKICYDAEPSNEFTTISCLIDDDEELHQLAITMSGKQQHHTTMNDQGEIVADCLIEMRNVALDGIPLERIFFPRCEYYHSFNTDRAPEKDVFWVIMGCNGTVKFALQGPVYLWMLENM